MAIIRLVICFAICLYMGAAVAAEPNSDNQPSVIQKQPDRVVNPFENVHIENGFDRRYLQTVSLNCGLKPLPPLGCKVGRCVCDANGQNCKWEFICN